MIYRQIVETENMTLKRPKVGSRKNTTTKKMGFETKPKNCIENKPKVWIKKHPKRLTPNKKAWTPNNILTGFKRFASKTKSKSCVER